MDHADFEKRLAEYLKAEGVQAIAVALKRNGPSTLRQLTNASGFSQAFVAERRDKMAAWGLVHVGALNKKTQLISLTPQGEKFVALIFKQVELLGDSRGAKDAGASGR